MAGSQRAQPGTALSSAHLGRTVRCPRPGGADLRPACAQGTQYPSLKHQSCPGGLGAHSRLQTTAWPGGGGAQAGILHTCFEAVLCGGLWGCCVPSRGAAVPLSCVPRLSHAPTVSIDSRVRI